jgi:hypothetical protein
MKKRFVPNDILQGTVYKKITYTIMVSFENGHNFRDACNYSCHRSSSGGGSGIGSSSNSCSIIRPIVTYACEAWVLKETI